MFALMMLMLELMLLMDELIEATSYSLSLIRSDTVCRNGNLNGADVP